MRGVAVMAVREFETWLLLSLPAHALRAAGVKNPESKRDAKGALARIVDGYKPTTHQLELTRRIDIAALRERSRSFDKFVRSVLAVTA
jgi:hypothetical protein